MRAIADSGLHQQQIEHLFSRLPVNASILRLRSRNEIFLIVVLFCRSLLVESWNWLMMAASVVHRIKLSSKSNYWVNTQASTKLQ